MKLMEHDFPMFHSDGADRRNWIIERKIDTSRLVTYDDAEVSIARQALGKHDLTRQDLIAFYSKHYDANSEGVISPEEDGALMADKRALLDGRKKLEEFAAR